MMNKDLMKINNNEIVKMEELNVQLKEASKVFNSLPKLSRIKTAMEKPLKLIDAKKMEKIISNLEKINDKVYNFSKGTSQVSRKLQSMSMLFPANATYRVIYQILAQIESRQQAVIDNYFRFKKNQIKFQRLLIEKEEIMEEIENAKKMEMFKDEKDKEMHIRKLELQLAEKEVEIEEMAVSVSNSYSYYEAAIKEIGFLTETYKEVLKNKNIDEKWTEEDFEWAEIDAMIKGAFRNCYRDFRVHGSIGMGTIEWFEQLGIGPEEAIEETKKYIFECESKKKRSSSGDVYAPDFNDFYDWLDRMAKKYHNCYKKIAKAIGLDVDKLISIEFTNNKKLLENQEETNKET